MPHDEQPGDPPTGLQFEHAEFVPAPASGPEGTPPVAAGPDARSCVACHRPIEDAYYQVANQTVCPTCRERLGAATPGNPAWRALKALAFGLVAAAIGSAFYYAIIAITGWNIGLVSIVVGALIGNAVRSGAGGRGGPIFQVMAVSLAYLAIASMFIPAIVSDMQAEIDQPPAAEAPAPAPAGDAPKAAQANVWIILAWKIAGHPQVLLPLGQFILMMPILEATADPISGLIFAFALWEAWKRSRGVVIQFSGPYYLAPAEGPPDGEKPEALDEL